jgi:hypothetical protein
MRTHRLLVAAQVQCNCDATCVWVFSSCSSEKRAFVPIPTFDTHLFTNCDGPGCTKHIGKRCVHARLMHPHIKAKWPRWVKADVKLKVSTEILYFWSPGGPGGPGILSRNVRGEANPNFLEGIPGTRGRPESKNTGYPSRPSILDPLFSVGTGEPSVSTAL